MALGDEGSQGTRKVPVVRHRLDTPEVEETSAEMLLVVQEATKLSKLQSKWIEFRLKKILRTILR